MGTRALEARLTARILALGAVVLVAVGALTLVVSDRVLDANDTAAARADAASSRDALLRELAEGDAPKEAADEVLTGAAAEGIRVGLRDESVGISSVDRDLPELPANACTSFVDARDRHWRACASEAGAVTAVAAVSTEAHRATVRSLSLAMALIVLAAILALWVSVRRVVRTPTAELVALVDWTTKIGEGDHTAPPPVTTTTEIARLEDAFDALLRRIFEALARERATSAHIAHELRTPLTSILAELDSLSATDETSRASIARVKSDVTRLADVIEAILVLSTTTSVGARGGVVNVADVARAFAAADLVVTGPDEALVEGDERLIALAIRNLLENAEKYAGGARTLAITKNADAVCVEVNDDGPGLDEASRAHMFDRYWRGAADGQGRGLGLAFVRAVAERHGGAAAVASREKGTGLTVSFTLAPCVGWHTAAPAPR